jgi:hypothetical protein
MNMKAEMFGPSCGSEPIPCLLGHFKMLGTRVSGFIFGNICIYIMRELGDGTQE